ncbi:MAG: hypothetical protein EAZ44_08755 [Cytophagia bacterium]|nr:MAG: hypothetical protein EAZ44_08755 [Cytophagia bacterium]TAG38550.1 MAG: hypothetical protein EAZ31_10360 [Cytophagia bacterium]TAH30328.1 MAG: hypothetical protein EAZ06_03685 [Cytophagales bacterium]
MKNYFLTLFVAVFLSGYLFAQDTKNYKFSNRNNSLQVEFLHLDSPNNPTKIAYRAAQDTKILDLEIIKKQDDDGNIVVKFPKKKTTWKIKLNLSFLSVIDDKNKVNTYSLEEGFVYEGEKIYVQYSLAGIGAFYYMPSSQVPPKELKVIKEQEKENVYDVIFPNNGGKATISFDKDNNMVVKKSSGTTKIFLRKN